MNLKLRIVSIVILMCLTGINSYSSNRNRSEDFILIVNVDSALSVSDFKLEFFTGPISTRIVRDQYPQKSIESKVIDGHARFELRGLKQIGYIRLSNVKDPNWKVEWTREQDLVENSFLYFYIIEPGDAVTLQINVPKDKEARMRIKSKRPFVNYQYQPLRSNSHLHYRFTGKGAEKYTFRRELDLVLFADSSINQVMEPSSGRWIADNFYDAGLTKGLKLLREYEGGLSAKVNELLRVDLISMFGTDWNTNAAIHVVQSRNSKIRDTVNSVVAKHIQEMRTYAMLSEATSLSMYFPYYVVSTEMLRSRKDDTDIDRQEIYDRIRSRYKGLLRDKVLYTFFAYDILYMPADIAATLLNKAKQDITHKNYSMMIREMTGQFSTGSKAYDFRLQDTAGNTVRLSDLKGKVIFLDVWYTGCTNCAIYYKYQVNPARQYFEKENDLVFVSVSIDTDQRKWIESINKHLYTSPDEVNLITNGKGSNDPFIQQYKIKGYPAPMVIDREGKIFNVSSSELRDKYKLIQTLQRALQKNEKVN